MLKNSLKACNFVKRWLQHRCFPVNIAKFLITPILKKSANVCFWISEAACISIVLNANTVKPLNSGHLRVLRNLSVIERCLLLGGNLKKTVTFGTNCFVCYSRHVAIWDIHYWEVSLYIKISTQGYRGDSFKNNPAGIYLLKFNNRTLEQIVRFFVLAIKMQVSRSYSGFIWFDVIARLSTFPHRFQAHPLFLTHLSSGHEAVAHLVGHSKRKKNLRSPSLLRFPFSSMRTHQKSA